MTTGGGAYYATAVALRAEAAKARESYPEALARLREAARVNPEPFPLTPPRKMVEPALYAAALIAQAVGFELAASLWGVAQAIEDAGWRGHPRPVSRDDRPV